jgi:hypothetical protein
MKISQGGAVRPCRDCSATKQNISTPCCFVENVPNTKCPFTLRTPEQHAQECAKLCSLPGYDESGTRHTGDFISTHPSLPPPPCSTPRALPARQLAHAGAAQKYSSETGINTPLYGQRQSTNELLFSKSMGRHGMVNTATDT